MTWRPSDSTDALAVRATLGNLSRAIEDARRSLGSLGVRVDIRTNVTIAQVPDDLLDALGTPVTVPLPDGREYRAVTLPSGLGLVATAIGETRESVRA